MLTKKMLALIASHGDKKLLDYIETHCEHYGNGLSEHSILELTESYIKGGPGSGRYPAGSGENEDGRFSGKTYSRESLPDDVKIGPQHLNPDDAGEEIEVNYRLNGLEDITYAVEDNEVIGHLGVDDEGAVKTVFVDEKARGKGVAEKLYTNYVRNNGSLKSDDLNAMEPGAIALWKKLQAKYPDEITKTKTHYVWTSKKSKGGPNSGCRGPNCGRPRGSGAPGVIEGTDAIRVGKDPIRISEGGQRSTGRPVMEEYKPRAMSDIQADYNNAVLAERQAAETLRNNRTQENIMAANRARAITNRYRNEAHEANVEAARRAGVAKPKKPSREDV